MPRSTPGPVDEAAQMLAVQLYQEHGQSLLRLAFLLAQGDAGLAEDLVQDSYERLLLHGVGDLTHPLAYARRAIVNARTDLHRRAAVGRRVAPEVGASQVHLSTPDPSGGVADRLAVLNALSRLSNRERAVIILRYYEDLPDPEIAHIVGVTRSTVRSLVRRGLAKLRVELDPTGIGGHEHV